MAQDETYQTTVYAERGGDRFVAGSGGTFAVESGGSILVYSGAQFDIESDGIFALAGADLSGDAVRRLLVSEFGAAVNITTGTALATESVLTQSNLPRNARIVNIIGAVSGSQCSFWLTSVSAGREVLIRVVGDLSGLFTYNNTSVCLLRSGCLLIGSDGAAVASMHLETSLNSDTAVFLKAVADDTWAVVRELGVITES